MHAQLLVEQDELSYEVRRQHLLPPRDILCDQHSAQVSSQCKDRELLGRD